MQAIGAENVQGWEDALRATQQALRECRAHGRALRRSLAVIEKKIAAGEPFPAKYPVVGQPTCI